MKLRNQIFRRLGQSNVRSGYTLMELLLALGLSVLVIGAIGLAIRVYLISLTEQQTRLERKQVVRSVFAMIGSDLRAGLEYKFDPADYAGLELALQNQVGNLTGATEFADLSEEDLAAEIEAAAFGTDSDTDSESESESESESNESEPIESEIIIEDEVAFRPTFVGSETAVMFDISRLPRLDQYNPLVAAADLETQTPSDVKSLAYFVSLDKGGIEEQVGFAESRAPGGLYRRELDRAAANFLGEVDLISVTDKYSRLVAHEIAEISFRYFDGDTWLSQWNSGESGRFPSAVEITIVIDIERSAAGSQTYSYNGPNEDTSEVYRYVVHLPVTDLPSSQQ